MQLPHGHFYNGFRLWLRSWPEARWYMSLFGADWRGWGLRAASSRWAHAVKGVGAEY